MTKSDQTVLIKVIVTNRSSSREESRVHEEVGIEDIKLTVTTELAIA